MYLFEAGTKPPMCPFIRVLITDGGCPWDRPGPFRPIALVVEDDVFQRQLAVTLLEENGMDVTECESGEAAWRALEKIGGRVSMMFTDVNLGGTIDGIELAHFAKQHYPEIHVIVTSGLAMTKSLPDGAVFLPKPWLALDLLREAEHAKK
jgi:CheY-like chemotaxis protein